MRAVATKLRGDAGAVHDGTHTRRDRRLLGTRARGAMGSKRMGLAQFLDACGEEFVLVEYCLDRVGKAGDDQCGRVSAWNVDALFVHRGKGVFGQTLGHPRCLRSEHADQRATCGFADLSRGAEPVDEPEHGRVLHSRAQHHTCQRQVDLRPFARSVADAVGFAGQVVVEADNHLQLGGSLVRPGRWAAGQPMPRSTASGREPTEAG
ncbi:hypothetical protein [Streptomyces sp. NBC_01707]|uniref:hypothetical protein n=1 Tax=Streptomyces sp. NBC_01707 TaxID=2975914 RepID=UPI00352DB523